jgi:hypothetical protein
MVDLGWTTSRIAEPAGDRTIEKRKAFQRESGAGEGIRTLDPDLGKVRVTLFLLLSCDCPLSLAID